MKASELGVGTVVALVPGTSDHEQRNERATKVEVVGPPGNGRCEVKFLEDANSNIGRSILAGEEVKRAGETMRVQTRLCWMPWASFETRVANMAAAKSQRDSEAQAREDKRAEIQRRIDQFAGEVDEPITWSGRGYSGNRYETDQESHVRIPTEALEAILDKAEGK